MKDKTVYTCTYKSKLGDILLAADAIGLTALWFEGQKYFANTLPDGVISQETLILTEAKRWLDIYFSGKEPDFIPPLHPTGSAFRQAVWQILLQIPYGQTTTYGEIAKKLAKIQNASHMSAQAVGGAVGHNEISIIIPSCIGTSEEQEIQKKNRAAAAAGREKRRNLLIMKLFYLLPYDGEKDFYEQFEKRMQMAERSLR